MLDRLASLCLAGVAPALPQDWWLQWSFAPASLLGVAALAWWALRLDGAQRKFAWAGCLLCAVAWISPLCRLGATLAAGHMAQLMVVVLAGALLALAHRVPADRDGARFLGLLTLAHAMVLWGWHVPAVYTAILGNAFVHVIAWGLLLASSYGFWRAVLQSASARPFAALLAVLATMAHTGLLGALLTLAGRACYAVQWPGARAWGWEPLADQQVAGLLMWVPGGGAYFAAALALSWRMLAAPRVHEGKRRASAASG